MQLSQNQKIIAEFFFAFCKFRYKFEHFQKKDDPHSWCIFELPDFEWRSQVNV